MELWLDCSNEYSEKNSIYADRIWEGDLPDVAEIYLEDDKSQNEAYSVIGLSPWILVRCKNWKMIPLENLISRSLGTGTKIAVSIDEKLEIEGAAFALEQVKKLKNNIEIRQKNFKSLWKKMKMNLKI